MPAEPMPIPPIPEIVVLGGELRLCGAVNNAEQVFGIHAALR